MWTQSTELHFPLPVSPDLGVSGFAFVDVGSLYGAATSIAPLPPPHGRPRLVLPRNFLHAAELVRQGYVPKVLVSGPHTLYGRYECDAAIRFAVEHGYPESWFIRAPHEALNTRDEAAAILPDLRRLGVHRFLLVTSNYHTARAARIFGTAGPDFDIRTVAAPDQYFRPGSWWRNREGQKLFFIEWSKTFAGLAGM